VKVVPPVNVLLLDHVRSRCIEDPHTGCWLWAGSLNRTGYNNMMTWPRYLCGDV
jgi:hypothetical protein